VLVHGQPVGTYAIYHDVASSSGPRSATEPLVEGLPLVTYVHEPNEHARRST
jgi:hypothetical protein